MTPADINQLRDLLAQATPGPWAVHYGYKLPHIKADDGRYILEAGTVYGPRTKADAALIVAAMNALPSLLDEVERLRADAARYRWLRDRKSCPLAETDPAWDDLDAAIDAAMKEESGEQSTSSFENFMEIPYGAR